MKRDIAEASGKFLAVLLEQHQNVPTKLTNAALELIATLNAHQLREADERSSHLREWAALRTADWTDSSGVRAAG